MRRSYWLVLLTLVVSGSVVALVIGSAAHNESNAVVLPLEEVPTAVRQEGEGDATGSQV